MSKWPTPKLAELVPSDDKINYGVVQPGPDCPGGIPLVRVGDLLEEPMRVESLKHIAPEVEASYRRSRLRGDEVLLACVGSVGAVALSTPALAGANVARAVARIRCGPLLERRFLAHYLRTAVPQRYFVGQVRKVAQPTLNIRQIEELPVPLPPLPEQKRIAAILDKADAIRRKRQQAIRLTEELLRSTFLDMFGDPSQGRARRGRLLELGEVVDVKGGKRLPKDAHYSLTPTAHPYIRVVDIANNTVCQRELRYLPSEVQRKIARYTISCDDVFISIAGTIGLVATIPEELSGANLTENAAKLVIKDATVLHKDYLATYLASVGQPEIQRRTMATSQPKLALFRIAEIPILLPTLDDQVKFAEFGRRLRKMAGRMRNAVEYERFSASLTQRAFSGKL